MFVLVDRCYVCVCVVSGEAEFGASSAVVLQRQSALPNTSLSLFAITSHIIMFPIVSAYENIAVTWCRER